MDDPACPPDDVTIRESRRRIVEARVERRSPRDGVRLSSWCLRQVLPTFVGGSAMLLLATVANVSAAMLFQPLLDKGVLGHEGSVLIPVVALQVFLLLARGVLAGIAFDLLARVSARLGQNLTLRIFDHLQQHSLSYFLDRPQAELLQLLRNDVVALELTLGQTAGQAIIATLQTLVTLLVIVAWEPRLALLCIVGLSAGAALIRLASRLTNRALGREIEANESIAGHLLMVLGMRGFLLRPSSSAVWARARLQQLLARYRDTLVRRRVLPNWVLVAGEQLGTVTYFGFYLAAAYLVAGGGATTGSLIAMAALVSYLIGSVNQLAPTYVGLGEARLRLGRIEEALATAPAWRDTGDAPATPALRGAFALDRVTVRYRDVVALRDVSLAVHPGRITAVIGRSGAGKTTLTLLLLGLIEPDAGQVTIDGIAIHRYGREALWRQIGYVPQEPILFRGSARENIMVGRSLADAHIVAAAVEAGIHGRLAAAPEGYGADLGENGYRLSAGERQRIGLARALAGRPSVLVLDEPTANLDAATDALIRRTIVDQRNAGRTILVVTHSPATLAIADDVIVLDRGGLMCRGSTGDAAIQAWVSEAMRGHAAADAPRDPASSRIDAPHRPI
jgi:ABC-type bacteriocin/lantibiotic exporter with double-glycine peptidase domain